MHFNRLFALFQILFGISVALGSTAEIAGSLAPDILPPEALAEYSRLHASFWVKAWVLGHNLVNFPLGVGFVAAGVGVGKQRAWALRWTRRCALALIALALISQAVLSVVLYPDLIAGRLGVEEPDVWLMTLIIAGTAVLIWPVLALVAVSSRYAPRLMRRRAFGHSVSP